MPRAQNCHLFIHAPATVVIPVMVKTVKVKITRKQINFVLYFVVDFFFYFNKLTKTLVTKVLLSDSVLKPK